MRTRNDELRSALIAIDLNQINLDPLASPIPLGADLLTNWHHRLGLAELNDNGPGIGPLNDAIEDRALAVLELFKNGVALKVANPLQHNLLRGLCGDSTEVF